MSHTIYVGTIAKRKNSTLQPTLSTSFDVLLKSPTSLHTPTFTIKATSFDYNYFKWDDRYYFVTDVVSLHNGLWEVSGVCDTLATFKADILASTQFVSYSSHKTSIWLPDTRIPVQKNATVAKATGSMASLLDPSTGFYVLSVVGETGCDLWCCTSSDLSLMLSKINDWSDELIDAILAGNYPMSDIPGAANYDWSTIESATESLAKMNMLTGFAGNAYSEAPNCIRSCIWVPFLQAPFGGVGGQIHLGHFDTTVQTETCKSTPVTGSASVSIPWQYADWRRSICEEVYLYLPLVGMINLASDELIGESAITVNYSATATDGCIAYQVVAGNQVIGSYGANCAVNYPIGISQQASAGEIAQTAFAGIEKMVSTGIQAASSINPAAWVGGAIGIGFDAIGTTYNVANTALSRHSSCIGGIGGGAGTGLDLNIVCFSVAHPTVIDPDAMQNTMGVPTMQPMALSGLSGYCECANAHVAASGAEASELAEIDNYLNSGFFIE